MLFLWLLVPLVALLGAGLFFSLRMTRRHAPAETRSPAEYGLAYEEVAFRARDGLTLRGWWIPAPEADRALVSLHGHGGSMDPDLQFVPAWHAAGFHVLTFDFRAHGRSDGRITTIGYLERQDAMGAVDFVLSRGIRRIGFLGFSMGGMVAMLTAPICPEVKAVVTNGGPPRLIPALIGWAMERKVPRWLAVPLAYLAYAVTSLRVGANLFRYQPVHWVGGIAPRPILIIHGDHDQFIPPTDFAALVAAARPPKEVWRIPEAGHCNVDTIYPDEFRRRVIAFLDKYL